MREAYSNLIEFRPTFPASSAQRMAVCDIAFLKHESTMSL